MNLGVRHGMGRGSSGGEDGADRPQEPPIMFWPVFRLSPEKRTAPAMMSRTTPLPFPCQAGYTLVHERARSTFC